MVGKVRHHRVEHHVHAHGPQVAFNGCRRFLAHSREQARACLDEVDVHQFGREVGIVFRHDEALHLGDGSGDFDAGGAASDDDHVQQLFAFGLRGAGQGALEVVEQGVAQAHGFADCFHRHGFFLDVFVAKEVRRCACCEDKIVIPDLAD